MKRLWVRIPPGPKNFVLLCQKVIFTRKSSNFTGLYFESYDSFFVLLLIVHTSDIYCLISAIFGLSIVHRKIVILVRKKGVFRGLKNIEISNTPHNFMDGFKSEGTGVLGCQAEYLSRAFGFFP